MFVAKLLYTSIESVHKNAKMVYTMKNTLQVLPDAIMINGASSKSSSEEVFSNNSAQK